MHRWLFGAVSRATLNNDMKLDGIVRKRRIIALFVALTVVLSTPATVLAASGTTNTRYFITSTGAIWRGAMGARHIFADGFTADLNEVQLRVAKLFGLKPIEVKKFNILADSQAVESVSPTPQITPTQSVPWGVRAMLGNEKLV